jgi:hypothetical protein
MPTNHEKYLVGKCYSSADLLQVVQTIQAIGLTGLNLKQVINHLGNPWNYALCLATLD